MNYAFYMGFCLLGVGLTGAIFFLLGAKRRAWIPRLPWWLYFLLGVAPILYGLKLVAGRSKEGKTS
jgi:hypothetical protein